MTCRALATVVCVLLLLLLSPAPSPATEGTAGAAGMPALVVLFRHTEKAAEPPGDPPLTKAGKKRARTLALALEDAGVTAIITSDTLRTRSTAQPLAEARGLAPKVVGLGSGGVAAHVEAVATEVRRQAGGVVVVVGHSDTIPAIIVALGGPSLPDVHHTEFAHLFLLVPGPGGARLVRARYGAPDEGP